MDAIIDLGRRYDLVVIEDAAHAHGASWRNRPVGSLGDFGSFSFQQSKNMTAGEGGILITNDAALAERARSVCNQGRRTGGAWYEHPALGSNFRLTGWQSAVLLAQLGRLPRQLEQRRTAAALLDRALYDSGIVSPPAVDSRATTHGWYLYTMRVNVAALEGVSKDVFVRALTAEGIPGASSYPQPIYGNTVFSGRPHRRTECPESERFARECFWVSHEVLMASSEALADFVRTIEKLRDCADELRELSAQTVS
jgi:dTDP-4-amino-4,6-dideoxygalactose transaminase